VAFSVTLLQANSVDYWVFGLFLSSGILRNTKEHNVSETGSACVLKWEEETPTLLGPVVRAKLNHWTTYVSITIAI
jgi:hypothetical protein